MHACDIPRMIDVVTTVDVLAIDLIVVVVVVVGLAIMMIGVVIVVVRD